MDFFNTLIYPFEWLVAWILYGWHALFTAVGLSPSSGLAWVLSIMGLVVVMRAAMIPLFVKQIHASRRMQLIQPELQKIQKKYKGKTDPESRQAMTQETMDLYKRTGTNPFSSCLPILLQSPFFFGLFNVLNGLQRIADGKKEPIGPITRELAGQAEASTLFGAQLSDKFMGADSLTTQIVTVLLIVLMSATTFTTQRQLMTKNMPASALDNPFARQQKMLLYVLPIIFAVSGVNFPIGVLIYWLVTNVWSMCQQFYVIRRMPTPGSPAEKAMHERRARKGKPPVKAMTVPGLNDVQDDEPAEPAKVTGQRQQPKGKKRQKRRPVGSTSGSQVGEGVSGHGSGQGGGQSDGQGGKEGVQDSTPGTTPDPTAGGTSGGAAGGSTGRAAGDAAGRAAGPRSKAGQGRKTN